MPDRGHGGWRQNSVRPLLHPVVAVGVVAVEQRAAQAGQQAGHVQPDCGSCAGWACRNQRRTPGRRCINSASNARILDH